MRKLVSLVKFSLYVSLKYCIISSMICGSISAQKDRIVWEAKKIDSEKYFYEHLGNRISGSSVFPELFQNRMSSISNEINNEIEQGVVVSNKSIGLIFHILYTNDIEEVKLKIQSQLDALNRDFSLSDRIESHPNDKNGQYASLATDSKISFYQVNTKATGTFGNGIATLRNSAKRWEGYDEMKRSANLASKTQLNREYINIWVVEFENEIASYASSPFQDDSLKGIVIDAEYFGVNLQNANGSKQGKLLTHLMGNYFGLKALYNEYDVCADDGVADTPIHNAPNIGTPKGNHFTTCPGQNRATEMTMNFMDSTNDNGQYMFTKGQVDRMHAVINSAYKNLLIN